MISIAAVCGQPSPKTAPTSTPVTPEAFKEIATRAINDSMLTGNDFPAGWTSTAPDPSNDADLKFSPQCTDLNNEDYPGAIVETKSLDFNGERDQQITTDGAVYATADLAAAQMQRYDDEMTRCHDEAVQVFHDYFMQALAGVGVTAVQVAIDAFSPPLQADRVRGFRVSIVLDTPRVRLAGKFDSYLLGYGRVLGSINYMDFGTLDQRLNDRLGQVFADRLKLTNAKLPN